MAKKATQIYSIFGQIEEVVAQAMVDEGVATKIPYDHIPGSARYQRNPLTGQDEQAKFAIVLPSNLVNVFEARIAALRA
jgi:hypothetical protein